MEMVPRASGKGSEVFLLTPLIREILGLQMMTSMKECNSTDYIKFQDSQHIA
jgi:hypothetical protein